jgi:hypothetical protein
MFLEYFESVRALMPDATPLVTAGTGSPAALEDTVADFRAFLDAE